ncbi:MAG: type III PLP-dependent enzyme [Nitrospirales bacterium]|nr:type III PLP-dependent enzyme [Nitrospira sp.]MDR4501918.1 type III PLP-dependent enzyme [Nitrospirales bacterium]
MPDCADLIARHFSADSGVLVLGQHARVDSIASQYGTPFFVYDSLVLDQKLAVLRKTLPKEFSISYSVKANPCQIILKHFLTAGCGLEIASGGEYFQARKAGCAPERIVFAGPGKTEDELEYVLSNGIGEIHAESTQEIARIAKISERLQKKSHVAIRVNPTEEVLGGAMRMGGKATPFGVDEELLDTILPLIEANPYLEFQGLHLFSGTQILDYAVLVAQYRKGISIAREIVKKINRPLKTIDFGGGWGIPYFGQERELDVTRLAEGLEILMTEVRHDQAFAGTQLMVEPGRFLVGESGVYVTRITDIKVSRGKKFLIVDGGMHHHLAASGNFGQVIKKNFPVGIVNKVSQEAEEIVDIVGPLCTPLDVLARQVKVPRVTVGDLVGVFQSGAYGRTSSPLHFLSHCSPPEILVEHAKATMVRARGTYDDMIRDCC